MARGAEARRDSPSHLAMAGMLLFAGVAVLAVLLRRVYAVYAVTGESMRPALAPGTRILARRFRPGRLRRGLPVVVRLSERTTAVKRVAGLPGETVTVNGPDVGVDGRLLWRYGGPLPVLPCPYTSGPVAPHHVFVLSDQLPTGADSRMVGPLHNSRVLGIAVAVIDNRGRWSPASHRP